MTNIQIALLGKETLPVYYPVKTEGADEVYIIRSNQNEEEAKRLKTVLEEEHIPCHIDNVVGAFDLKSINEVCENIHTKLPEDCSVTYNVTGGTKLMTIAALLVALNHNARVIYTDSNELIDVTNVENKTLSLKMKLETFFKLQGQELWGYKLYKSKKDLISCCNQIMMKLFLSKSADYYYLRSLYLLYRQKPGLPVYKKGKYKAEINKNCIVFYKEANKEFTWIASDILMLAFGGRWWETLIAEKVYQWSNGRYDIYQNVTFSSKKGSVKNEIDVLVNLGTKLLFIECKSGDVDQNVISKMDTVRRNYGSVKSESVLISLEPVSADLKEKAKDCKICVIDRGTDEVDASLLNRIAGRLTDYLSTIKP